MIKNGEKLCILMELFDFHASLGILLIQNGQRIRKRFTAQYIILWKKYERN